MKDIWEQTQLKFSLWLDGLSNRERRLLFGLGIVLVLVLVFSVSASLIGGLSAKQEKLKKGELSLLEIKKLEAPYKEAKMKEEAEWQRIRKNNISLFSLVQSETAKLSLQVKDLQEKKTTLPKGKIVEISVNLNLTKLSIDRLKAFLEALELSAEGGLVKVTRMKINSRYDEADLWMCR